MGTPIIWWRLIAIPAVLLLIAYALLFLCSCTLTDRALFHPNYVSRRAPPGLQKIRVGSDEIALLHIPNPQARYTLWFFHGNAEGLGDTEPFLLELRDRGYAVFAFDYPGYGHSTGRPNEQSVYAAARASRAHLRDVLKVPAECTILYGRSLGGGPAVQMAVEERPAGLVLQSSFVSVFRVVTRYPILPGDRFRNLAKLPGVTCPVLVMHGREDEVVSFHHGETLFAAANEPKQSLWVPGAMHNNFLDVAGPRYWEALRSFTELCAKTGGPNP